MSYSCSIVKEQGTAPREHGDVILTLKELERKVLGITRATALNSNGTTALREVTCPVVFRKSCLSG